MSTAQKLMITVVMALASIASFVFVWLLVSDSKAAAENRVDLIVSLGAAAVTDEFAIEDIVPGGKETYRITVGSRTEGKLAVEYAAGDVQTLAPYLRVSVKVNGEKKLSCSFVEFTERVNELTQPVTENEKLEMLVTYSMPTEVGNEAAEKELKFSLKFILSNN